MIKRMLFVNRLKELSEDIIIGTVGGGIWGLLVLSGWSHFLLINSDNIGIYSYYMVELICISVGALSGFFFIIRASIIYGERGKVVGIEEYYGRTGFYISLTVSIVINAFIGGLLFGVKGMVISAGIGTIIGVIGFPIVAIVLIAAALFAGLILFAPFSILHYLWKIFALSTKQRQALNHYIIGVKLDKSNDIQSAIDAYQSATKLEPAFSEAHLNLAFDYGLNGQQHEEISHYKKALALKQDYSLAIKNLVLTYLEQGNKERAIDLLKSKKQIIPKRIFNGIKKNF